MYILYSITGNKGEKNNSWSMLPYKDTSTIKEKIFRENVEMFDKTVNSP